MKNLIIVTLFMAYTCTASKNDSLDAKIARITLTPKSIILDGKIILQTSLLRKGIGQKRLEEELVNRKKTRILLKTDVATPYSVFYDFYNAIGQTNAKSATQYTDEFDGYYFVPKEIPEPSCDFKIDSMHLVVIVGDTFACIGWGKNRWKEVMYKNEELPKLELREVFSEIAKNYRCAPDFQDVIIAADDKIKFKNVLDVMYVAHTTFFQYISFAKLRKFDTTTVSNQDFKGYFIPNDNRMPKNYREEMPDSNTAYFKAVRDHFQLIGRNVPEGQLLEYTGSILIASFPPVAEVYDSLGFIGFTSKSYLYFKPGEHTITIQKGFYSTTKTIEIKKGNNPAVAVRLAGAPPSISRMNVPIPPFWFDDETYQLNDYGEYVVNNFCELVRSSGNMNVVMIKILCPNNEYYEFDSRIDDRHSIVLEKLLNENGIKSTHIKKRTDVIKDGYCQESLYIVQENDGVGAPRD